MASSSVKDSVNDCERSAFFIITNIPQSYRSCDLRNFFVQLLESESFLCFHYKHRPVALIGAATAEADQDHGEDQTDCRASRVAADDRGDLDRQCLIDSAGNDQNTDCSKPESTKTRLSELSRISRHTFCCIIRIKSRFIDRLVKAYDRHHWIDRLGDPISAQCRIYPVHAIVFKESEVSLLNLDPQYVHVEGQPITHMVIPLKELLSMKELQPPDIMPQGNVGTTTKHFLNLINACKLPPGVVRKLGLKFRKVEGSRIYSCVPLDYLAKTRADPKECYLGPAVSENGKRLLNHEQYTEQKRVKDKLAEGSSPPSASRRYGEDSDEEAEEWDRHAAFDDDPTNSERNKERLYEERIELKWEKGGSGLVFYTDAQYWQQQEGDFDEQTADDWDVDMSEYSEPGTGDKDARDFLQMRAEKRLRSGTALPEEITSFDSSDMGCFEQHTKGVGHKILKRQGWREGHGVGKSVIGRANIIDNDGKKPRDKTGLGYHGEKINRYYPTQKRPMDTPIISTVYDDPAQIDPVDTLRQRQNPHSIKHRVVSNTSVFKKPSK